MKGKTIKRKSQILRACSLQEINARWVRRLDDDLFTALGAGETSVKQQKEQPPHFLAWKGFQILTDSPHGE